MVRQDSISGLLGSTNKCSLIDGQFWMTYRDFLRKFDTIDRTRLFDDTWHVTESRWINYEVTWAADYAPTQFEISIVKPGPIVVVLSQLDTRFFRGLEGRFEFTLAFRIHKDGEKDYLARSQPNGTSNNILSLNRLLNLR